jgi:hypothetical protein
MPFGRKVGDVLMPVSVGCPPGMHSGGAASQQAGNPGGWPLHAGGTRTLPTDLRRETRRLASLQQWIEQHLSRSQDRGLDYSPDLEPDRSGFA